MDWFAMVGFCLVAAAMIMVLRQMQPYAAGLLSIAFGVLVIGAVLPQIGSYVAAIEAFLASLDLHAQYYKVMIKSMGIVLVTQICAQICMDMEAPSVARRVELCGRIALLGIAVPVFMELTQMAVSILQ
ncbi:MAG: hypothetical protein IJ381_06855 [Clostridia bacterium]|nr:hypothetical protein [Clostridia bacterium]